MSLFSPCWHGWMVSRPHSLPAPRPDIDRCPGTRPSAPPHIWLEPATPACPLLGFLLKPNLIFCGDSLRLTQLWRTHCGIDTAWQSFWDSDWGEHFPAQAISVKALQWISQSSPCTVITESVAKLAARWTLGKCMVMLPLCRQEPRVFFSVRANNLLKYLPGLEDRPFSQWL